jgi:hypothetical protein
MPERFEGKVLGTHHALDGARLPHAFGGAIALAYYAIPRATVDIDINVFVPESAATGVLEVLAALSIDTADAGTEIARAGQCRVMWENTPVDLFFANLPLHEAMQRAVRGVPFAGETIPILAPEHLLVCKSLFNRRKDWLDIADMLVSVSDLRVDEVTRWLDEIAGPDDGRTVRVRSMLAEFLGR